MSGGEDDSDVPDVTEGDADMSLDLLACSSYGAEVSEQFISETALEVQHSAHNFRVPRTRRTNAPFPPTPT